MISFSTSNKMAIIGTVPFRLTDKNQQLYKVSLICAWTGKWKLFPWKASFRVTFTIIWYLKDILLNTKLLDNTKIIGQKQTKDGDNWSSTSTAEMRNVNAKRKTESDIRIFKDLLPTVGEIRNPEDIGVEEMNMHLEDFFFSSHEIQTGLRTDSLKCIQASISRHLSDGECWLIDAIVSTIETYENRTVTPISISNNSVQSTVTNNNCSANRYRFGSNDAQLQYSTIRILK